MASFNTALDALIVKLQDNAALKAFCLAKWNKELTILRVFKNRTEINLSELPVMLVTRPSVVKNYLVGARDGMHSLHLYVAFQETDRIKAQEILIGLEEAIDDALLSFEPGSVGLRQINPEESANDEGLNHPNYSMAMKVSIQHRR